MTAHVQTPSPSNSAPAAAPPESAPGATRRGLLAHTHYGLVLLGAALALSLITLSLHAGLRHSTEQHLLGWLLERQDALAPAAADEDLFPAELSAIERVTAAAPEALPKAQANVTFWLSRKYRVAPEPLSVLVAEAFRIGEQTRLDPTLILAVMAIESGFNPFAESPMGAQGLMQVMTRVHTERFDEFGGQLAAFDPLSNLRVGAQILKEGIRRAGSVEGGLRLYVGAVSTSGSGYINRVMAEQLRIQSVARGLPMPRQFPYFRVPPVATPVLAPTTPDTAPSTPAQDHDELSADATLARSATPEDSARLN